MLLVPLLQPGNKREALDICSTALSLYRSCSAARVIVPSSSRTSCSRSSASSRLWTPRHHPMGLQMRSLHHHRSTIRASCRAPSEASRRRTPLATPPQKGAARAARPTRLTSSANDCYRAAANKRRRVRLSKFGCALIPKITNEVRRDRCDIGIGAPAISSAMRRRRSNPPTADRSGSCGCALRKGRKASPVRNPGRSCAPARSQPAPPPNRGCDRPPASRW